MHGKAFRIKTTEEPQDVPEADLRQIPPLPVQKRSLRYTIWKYFMIFIILVLGLLWTFQIVLLPVSYQAMKTRSITKVVATILTSLEDKNFEQIIDRTAYDNSMSILIMNLDGSTAYFTDMMGGNGELKTTNFFKILQYRQLVDESASGYIYFHVTNDRFKTETLLFGSRIGTAQNPTGYIFINTSLDPISSTVAILQEQLVYVTFALLSLGLVLSFFMAKRIARPIVKITKSAEHLAQGSYNITFDGTGYDEVERLASTLNYASTEISKIDNLRRDLIANISHDLRTPLTMVKAYAEMVRDLSGDNPIKRAEHINVIIKESDRLAMLVNDILDLSRIESGNQELNLAQFGISQKLTEILQRYTLLSEQQGYVFHYEKADEVQVCADVLKIEQVIYNLINNAVNYTGADKQITIRQINGPNSVRIEIIDTGEGIAQEKLPLIFDRYYRTEKSKREVIGNGLGLSIVKAILKQHNFPFGVVSQLGKGSTFWFEIVRA